MNNILKRLIALILAMAMSLSLLSANVWAAEVLPQEAETSTEEVGPLEETSISAQSAEENSSAPVEKEVEELTEDEPALEPELTEEIKAKPEQETKEKRQEAEEAENNEEDEKEKEPTEKGSSKKGRRDDDSLTTQEVVASGTCGTQGDNVTWMLDEEGTLIIGGSGEMENYKNSYPSEDAAAPWFVMRESIQSIIIKNGVTSIGDYAFEEIGLYSIEIPESVTSIGDGVFYECHGLYSITLPDGVTSIGDYLFFDCTNLTSVILPDNVTSIGENSFGECRSLSSIAIPNGVTSIGSEAFRGCSSLTCVSIPDGVTRIEYGVFSFCENLSLVTIPDSVTSIGDEAFGNCRSLCNITIPDRVTNIGGAFSYCTSLKSITIPNGVTSIGDYAFCWCSNLCCITIPDSVTSIGDGAFSECGSLSSIAIPDSVTSLGNFVFSGCNVSNIRIPYGVTSIGVRMFAYCSNLTNVTIPNSVTIIGTGAFEGCSRLSSITIPDGVTRIETDTFSECGSLSSITIPNGVTSIGYWAFYNCASMTRITIPNSMISIDNHAFYRCSSLNDVYYEGTQDNWNKISIERNNEPLKNATIHYNSTGPMFVPKDAEQITGDFEFRSALNGDNNVVYSFSYADVWLMDDDPEFRYALMKTSIRVAQAAFTKNDGNTDGTDNIRKMMKDMGYEYTANSINYETPNINTIGSAIGMKNIKKADGSYQSLILVAIRGGGYGTEWGGNFNVGNDSKYHVGFKIAADTVRGRLSEFMTENQENINDPIVWITGFSRGAATSNLLASYLIHNNPIEGIESQNVLAYCFECPKNVIDPNASSNIYDNIINVVNPIDFVPKVAFNRWKFTRYGKTLYIPSRETTANFESKYKIPMIWKYQDLVEYHNGKKDDKISLTEDHVVELIGMGFVGQASNLDALADEISSKISKENYYDFVQDNMVEITANTLGGAGGKTDWYAAAVSMILAIVAPRDAKDLVKDAIQLSLGRLSPTTKIELAARAGALAVHAPSVIKMFKNGSDPGPGPSAHYSELCMSWVDSLSDFSNYWRGENTWYRQHIINCPVDVTVRDHTGKVVGKVSNHQVEEIEDGVTAYVDENDQIVFALPMTEKYTVDVQATDNGSVDYMIQEVNGAEGTLENVITYQEIPVTQGDMINVQSENNETELSERYVLKKEDEENPREPDAVLTEEEVERFAVTTAARGSGTVTGGGYVVKSEYVKVTANPEDEAQFLGWYEGETCVCQTEEYRFPVEREVELTAVFTEISKPAAQVFGHTLTLEGQIGVNTYLLFDDNILNDAENYQVEFWKAGTMVQAMKVSDVTPVQKTKDNQTYYSVYGFTVTTVAKEANTVFTMKIKNLSTDSYIDFANSDATTVAGNSGLDYAITDYLDDRIDHSADANMVALAKDMKAYCTYAKHYFDVRDSGSQEALPSIDGFTEVSDNDLPTYTAPENIEHFNYVGTSLVLEDQTSFRLYFVSDDKDALTISNGDTPMTIHEGTGVNAGRYFVEVKNIVAKNLDTMYTFNISNGMETTTATHGPMGYAKWAIGSSSNENLKYAMMALYHYNQSAKAYFTSSN